MARTLIRIDHVNDRMVHAVIPSWDPHRVVPFRHDELPPEVLRRARGGQKYFHAVVNMAAELAANLNPNRWELS